MEYTLITGACGGIGTAFSEILAARKTALYLTGRSAERLQALADRLRETYAVAVRTFVCDLRNEGGRMSLFRDAEAHGIAFSRLVYVAGVDTQMAFAKYTEEKIVWQCRANFEGAVSLMRGVLARAENAEILAVGSRSATVPMPYFALYSATKKALEHFCAALRAEYKGRAKITCVLPGSVPTREDIKENIRAHGFFGRISAVPPERVARAALKAVAHNRRKKIVGGWNRVLCFFSALAPMPLKQSVVRRMWKRTEKDYYRE